MKIAIHQPNFLPWIGFFHKLAHCDKFVLLDDIQFERGKTFTSRTQLLIGGSANWLTVPVVGKSSLNLINETRTDSTVDWQRKHLRTLELNYRKSPHYNSVMPIVENAYACSSDFLLDYNLQLIKSVAESLGISTLIVQSSSMPLERNATGWDKLFDLITYMKADTYLSGCGEGSKRYVNTEDLASAGINLEWQNYQASTYKQVNSRAFIPNLSIIDALFNIGFEGTHKLLKNET